MKTETNRLAKMPPGEKAIENTRISVFLGIRDQDFSLRIGFIAAGIGIMKT